MALKWFNKKKNGTEKDPAGREGAADQEPAGDAKTLENGQNRKETSIENAGAGNEEGKKGFFNRLRRGLSKTRDILTTDIDELFTGRRKLDEAFLEELEERLITADLGVAFSMQLIEDISKHAGRLTDVEQLKNFIKQRIVEIIKPSPPAAAAPAHKPHIVMVIGVNGVGKTTTIAKLAALYRRQGQRVLISAADTFRAAAVEQLAVWAERAGADIVRHKDNADPSAVVFDSIGAAVSRDMDLVFIDTAGRLHTKVNLMEELKKIKRTAAAKINGAPHEILLVLDATTGQNALSQATMFNEALDITGLALTKLDGTAKGGIVVGICSELQIPLQYIGVGEGLDDLQPFDARQFVDALF